jgi:hypothetical protein
LDALTVKSGGYKLIDRWGEIKGFRDLGIEELNDFEFEKVRY